MTTVTRVIVSPAPATIAYLGLGRGWWVPLVGPLNPANMALGCGFFDMVTRLELSTDLREVLLCPERDPPRAFLLLNVPTSTFKEETMLNGPSLSTETSRRLVDSSNHRAAA